MGSPSLTVEDRRLLNAFRETVTREFGAAVREILVFGSKARGDSTAESDLDILVLIDAGDWRFKDQIADVAYDLAIKTEVVPSVVVYTLTEWDHLGRVGSTFQAAVTHDGVPA